MVTPGTEITYTYSGAKESEDVSEIDELIIKRMDGAGGGSTGDDSGGAGGEITAAVLNITDNSSLDLWVGQSGSFPDGGFGRFNGGDGGSSDDVTAPGGGGSTELVIDNSFVAAADGGGGAKNTRFGSGSGGGGGGARGGSGGEEKVDVSGEDGEGSGFGGDGGNNSLGSTGGENGGQELGQGSLFDRGETTDGGGGGGDGEIVLLYDTPLKPLSLTAGEDTSGVDPAVELSWTNDSERTNRVYRSDVDGPTFPDDFAEVETVAEGVTTYTDPPPDYETTYTYRVTAESVGESDPSDPVTITTSREGELVVTITNTNSPVTTGDTLDFDVDVENVGDYRADEDIDAVLEFQ